ncbi:hypothetical protein NM208_g15801 [Fusarium decemcellulare]|uniref:Uncharacterized protein n=1 Tax=Fusarium decemcellulare TaxID=57161 RepID=A0ACC1REM3_9HYPO|nr:hypothetical protein NM208_g15801 [Fusarium decemcellulare]
MAPSDGTELPKAALTRASHAVWNGILDKVIGALPILLSPCDVSNLVGLPAYRPTVPLLDAVVCYSRRGDGSSSSPLRFWQHGSRLLTETVALFPAPSRNGWVFAIRLVLPATSQFAHPDIPYRLVAFSKQDDTRQRHLDLRRKDISRDTKR